MSLALCSLAVPFLLILLVNAQSPGCDAPPNSWPQTYPGMPSGDYGPDWQPYFQVTESLPNVTWPLSRNWAGNIPVQRTGHPNNTLFFWAFESSNGSFTANSTEPWGIWLNGGPAVSSLYGLLFENGPIHIRDDYSVFENQYAWTNVADYVWMDQPVGTGWSTVDSDGYVYDEDQMAADFLGFLDNFVKVFPNLAKRPLHITGESYAGMYIPYIAKAYFEMEAPPINLARIAMGDGSISSYTTFNELPVVSVLETYPQIIGYDPEVLEYFREQAGLCGYNLTLKYPQPEHFPTVNYTAGGDPASINQSFAIYRAKSTKQEFTLEVRNRFSSKLAKRDNAISELERMSSREAWKRGLEGRPNGTIDPWYGCDLYDEMVDYAVNFTFPWSLAGDAGFDIYDIPDALSPETNTDASVFLNDPRTRAALHAPTSVNWTVSIDYPFGSNCSNGDPSVEPMAFLTDLATNATIHDMKIILFSGNDDSLIPHLGTQLTIQNTTFCGIQGFTRKPETPWYNDAGEFAGIVHQERGWKYILAVNAGHILAQDNPVSALTLAREFIFGDNETGLVVDEAGSVTVIGGEDPSLGKEIFRGQAGIYYGSATTASTYLFPTKTVEAWDKYFSTVTWYDRR